MSASNKQQTDNLYEFLVHGPPCSIKVVVSDQDAVVFSWLPPDQPNVVIVQYNIYELKHKLIHIH